MVQIDRVPSDLFEAAAAQVRHELVNYHFVHFVSGLAEMLSPLAMPRRNSETMRAIYIVSPDALVVAVQLLSVYYAEAQAFLPTDGTSPLQAPLQLVMVRGPSPSARIRVRSRGGPDGARAPILAAKLRPRPPGQLPARAAGGPD